MLITNTLKYLIFVTGFLLTTSIYAMPVNFYLEGTVSTARNTNPYNLFSGDTVFARASFDKSLIATTGASEIGLGTFGNSFGASLELTIGTRLFNESDDLDYVDFLFPTLNFNNGVFAGLDFATEFGRNNSRSFESTGMSFTGINTNNGRTQIVGAWNPGTMTITPVASIPEPSSLVLLGLGVIGLLGAEHKRLS